MKLSDILTIETIQVPLTARDKHAAIEELIDLLHKQGKIAERDGLLKAVLDREATRSTGIGHGLAVPHGKCCGLDCLVAAVGKPQKPLHFDSIDGKPVNLVVLLGSNFEQTGPHIQALARISRFMMMPSFRNEIENAQTAEEIMRTILRHEQ